MKEALWLIDQLVLQGVTQFCIAPGSRSAPLALAAKNHPKTEVLVHFDERGLGFYALGYGLGAKKPAALIVTSGTAVANLFPSLLEAYHSHVPMLVLTADRPPELQQRSANQTMDQVKIFEGAVQFQMNLPPVGSEDLFRSAAAEAVFQAVKNPPGPVHLNCQYRDPLYREETIEPGNPIPFLLPRHIAPPFTTSAKRGLILLGKIPESPKPVLDLAKRLGWPLFADLLSQGRAESIYELPPHLCPDLILHFGDRLTREWNYNAPVIHISPYPTRVDPTSRNPTRILSDIAPFCKTFSAKKDPTWLPLWKQEMPPPTFLSEFATKESAFFFGNSLPIRDADRLFFPKETRGCFANRGLSGIDGNIATIAGLSQGLKRSVIGYIGDQTALHDLNSLPLIRDKPITLIISNNQGGGIFSRFAYQASPHFDTLFTASHTWQFEHAAQMFGIPYATSLENSPQPGLIELDVANVPLTKR